MSEKNYMETNIRKEINKKINTIDKTRTNRIFASERLYNYSKKVLHPKNWTKYSVIFV